MRLVAQFDVNSAYVPTGDQPTAFDELTRSINAGNRFQTLLGATATGKTAAMAWTIEKLQRPALVIGRASCRERVSECV